jgi:F-type H+-transporting ATPase subunit b
MLASSNFLVPGATFLLELIAFGLVLFFIAKYVLPPLRRAMDQRAEHIRNSIEAAEAAKREAEESSAKRRELLESARTEARAIVDRANQLAEQLKEEGRQRGQEEHARLVATAQGEIDAERDRARAEVMNELSALVLDAAERVIGAGLDGDRHRALVDDAIVAAQAGSAGAASGSSSAAPGSH